MEATLQGEAAILKREPVCAMDSDIPEIHRLDALLNGAHQPSGQLIGPGGERLNLPAPVYQLLAQIAHELARGNAVVVTPVHAELTTQQAAELLNVSRPYLIKLLESGAIPFHRVGIHRRVRLNDLLAYRHQRSQARQAALAEMAREAQEVGVYE